MLSDGSFLGARALSTAAMGLQHIPANAAAMGQRGCCIVQNNSPLAPAAWLLRWLMVMLCCQGALAVESEYVMACPGKSHCVALVVDGTATSVPPLFRNAITNSSINEIVLAGSRYVLRPSSWSVFTQQEPYTLRRNLTVSGNPNVWAVMDFSLIEKKVLIGAGVTVTFRNLVLSNIRKLGGFGLDFFMGEAGSRLVLDDTIRVKPACQLPADVLRSARTFQRVSPEYPPNDVRLAPQFCFTAALDGPVPQPRCYQDALQFNNFSLLASYNDPDKGSPHPGYILYHENTTRVCQSTITPQCMQDTNGDEELCMAMLVAAAGFPGQAGKGPDGRVSGSLSPGLAAGVAVAGGILLLMLVLLCFLRKKLLQALLPNKQLAKGANDVESGLGPAGADGACGQSPSYTGRNISEQVALNTLLGTGSFGRVYKGRWHSTDVAIKIVTVRNPEELPRVMHEAEVMMKLDHANIVHAYHASVWNPTEQMRALKVRAFREARNSSSSHVCGEAAPAAAAAAAANAGVGDLDRSVRGARQQGIQHSNSGRLRKSAGCTNVGSAPAGAATTASGHQLATPSVSSEPPVVLHHHNTSSTCVNSSGNLLFRSGTMFAAAGPGVITDAAAEGKNCADTTGWLQLAPRQQQQQPLRSVLNRVSSTAADCSSSMQADVSGRGQRAAAAGEGGEAAAPQPLPQSRQYLRSSSDKVLDVTHHSSAAAQQKGVQQQSHTAPQPLPTQQQKQPGGLLRPLLANWRQKRSSSADTSSTVCSPTSRTATATATAAAAPAGASTGGGTAATSCETRLSSAQPAAEAARQEPVLCLSGGGAVAILQTTEVQGSPRFGSKPRSSGGKPSAASRTSNAVSVDSTPDGAEDGNEESADTAARAEQQVWIILELCTGGTLLDAALCGKLRMDPTADHYDRKMGLAKLLSRLLDAARGMAYLHSRGVLHGDLKAGNVLLQHSIHGSYGQIAKISDFGLSAVLINGCTHRSTASLGTITHMAPELLRNGRMSPAADVYSFGVLMWEVYCCKQAWHGLHYGVVVERVVIAKERPPVPPDMWCDYELLMTRCWEADPQLRPTFEQIVECLELMLDNLGSSDGEDSERDVTLSEGGPAAPAAAAAAGTNPAGSGAAASQDEQRPERQQQLPPQPQADLLQPHVQPQAQQRVGGLFGPALVPRAAAAVLPGPAVVPDAAAAVVAYVPGGGSALSDHTSPSTPMNALHTKRQCTVFDSGLVPSGGSMGAGGMAHASRGPSDSSHPRSSSHSSQPAQDTTGSRRPSTLDPNMFLQDL